MTGSPARVVIGRLGRPHGIAGTLHARPTGPTLATVGVGERVWVRTQGRESEHVVAASDGTADRLRLRFVGVETRDDAQSLTGGEILVEEGRIARLDDPDTFYVTEMIGCTVVVGDRALGEVTEVHAAPANDALEVLREDGPVLIPFTADAVIEVDLPGRRIVLRPDLLD